MSTRKLFLVLLLGTVATGQQEDCNKAIQLQTEVGKRLSVNISVGDMTPAEIPDTAASYLRARLHVTVIPDCDWAIVIRDSKGRVMEIRHRDEFSKDGYYWTTRVPGTLLSAEEIPCKNGSKPKAVIDSYISMPSEAAKKYYSFQTPDQPTFEDLFDSEKENPNLPPVSMPVKRLGDNVGFLMLSYNRKSWVCTGVMLREGLLLTNWHCGGIPPIKVASYWSPDIVEGTLVDLSWDGDEISREYIGTRLIAGSSDLDYALVQVKRINASGSVMPIKMDFEHLPPPDGGPSQDIFKIGDGIYIIHHVAGKTKQVSSCKVTGSTVSDTAYRPKAEFTHKCDTEKGSSGAPVFDKSRTLIGLHHDGFKLSDTCKPLDKINKAIRISYILRDIEKQDSSVFELLKADSQH